MSHTQIIAIFVAVAIAILTGAAFIIKALIEDILTVLKQFPSLLDSLEEIKETLKEMPSKDFIKRVEDALGRLEQHNADITRLDLEVKRIKADLERYHERTRATENDIFMIKPLLDSEVIMAKNTDAVVKGLAARMDKLEAQTFVAWSGEDRRKS